MDCPHCSSFMTSQLAAKTSLGYKAFRCSQCRRKFNERTGTPFNYLEFPTDIVLLVVLWRLRYKLSLRDLAEMFLSRGFEFTHETVRNWEACFAPCMVRKLRPQLRIWFIIFHSGKTPVFRHGDTPLLRSRLVENLYISPPKSGIMRVT